MPSFIYKYSFTCIFFTVYAFPFINSFPAIESNPYDVFIKFLSKNNCIMPKAIALPFKNVSSFEPSNFGYLSTPLQECQTFDALEKNDEAYLLCKEIFDVLQNITCVEYNLPTRVETNNLSENVCKDFSEMQYVLPKRKDYLSAKLVDDMICRLMCTKDKYKLLCETLLWTYEALEKIKSANALQDEKNKIDVDAASQDKAPLTNMGDLSGGKPKADIKDPKTDVNKKESDKPGASVVDVLPQEGNPEVELKSNNGEVPKTETSEVLDQIPQIKSDTQTSLKSGNSSTTPSETETGSKMTSPLKNVATTKASKGTPDTENFNVIQNDSNKEHVESAKKGILPDLNIQDGHHVNQGNDINVDEQPKKGKGIDEAQQNLNTNNLLTASGETESLQQTKSTTNSVLKNTKDGEVTLNNNGSSSVTTKSEETVAPDMKNELSNVNLQEDDNKVALPKNEKDDKEAEKPKLTDFGVQGETTSTTNLPLLKTTPQLLPDDEEQHQENKDQEQYNDTENEGDYPKPDYDNAFNPPPKDKESDVKGSIIVSSQISNNYDTFNPRSSIGRIPEDIPMIPSFPEQEDSHFFFYFLSIVLILMAGYLIFHNKQKIIALIVEGRHERRRRCHGVGYKKLETK